MRQDLDKRRLMCAARIGMTIAWFLAYGLFGQLLGLAFDGASPIALSVIVDIAFFFAGVRFYRRLKVESVFSDSTDKCDSFSLVWRSVFLFVLWFCSYIIGNVISFVFSDLAMEQYIAIQTEQVIPFMVLSIFVAPVVEELLFRGVGYLLLRPYWGILFSGLCTSLLFGLLHGTLAQCFLGLMFGFGQCLLFEYTHRLRWCILMHFLVNVASFVISCLSIPVDLFVSGPLVVFLLIIITISFAMLIPENRF